jgi:hypothetical protein
MSSSDYITLKKSKQLQNVHYNTASTVNLPQLNYENYVHNLNLRAIKCSTATYGNGAAKPLSFNGVPLGRTTGCPANSYEGPVTAPIVDTLAPLISNPSVPTKFQMPSSEVGSTVIPDEYKVACTKACTPYMQSAREYNAGVRPWRRQWNLKKAGILSVSDSTTFSL